MLDFIVVGAGPAGSRFARSSAERGRDVLVLERGTVGRPLACSGHVSLDVWDYVPEAAREDLLQNAIRGARFHLGGPDSPAHPFHRDEPISNAVDRVELDRVLACAASEAGAEVREDHTVTSVDETSDRVVVEASGIDGVEEFEARMVVGADGPRSRVREQCSLPDPDEFLHGVLGFQSKSDHSDFVDVHLTVPKFFAWRIPRGDAGVEYGLAVRPGNDVRKRFETFLSQYGAVLDERCSGLIPIGPPSRVTGKRSLLVGDAAGQTKPFTGGGILYGMRAADYAAQTVDPTNPRTLGDYEDSWRDDLGTEIRLGHYVRSGYSLPRPIQEIGMRAFSGKIGVHMDEPSSLFSKEQFLALLSKY